MINLLEKESLELGDKVRNKLFQVELLEQELACRRSTLQKLEEKEEELQEELDDLAYSINRLKEWDRPLRISNIDKMTGVVMMCMDKVGFEVKNLRYEGEHFLKGFEALRVKLPDPHWGDYVVHIIPNLKSNSIK